MARENLHSITGYPESIDLRYYASSFNDKLRTSKLLQNQMEQSNLDDKLFAIKRKPRTIHVDSRVEYYRDSNCRNCFRNTNDFYTDNYYLNILDIRQLFSLRGSVKLGFKFLRFIFSKNDCSIDVSDSLIKNEELLNFVKEYELYERDTNQSTAEGSTYNSMISWVVEAAKEFAYNLSYFTLKFIGIIIYTFSWIFISRLVVSSSEIENIRKSSNSSLVYLLKNSSKIDSFIVLISLLFMDFKIPVVLLYETNDSKWLRWFLKKCGIIFIRPPPSDILSSDPKHGVYDEAWLIFVEELIRAKNHFILCLDTPSHEPDNWFMTIIADSIRRKAVDDILVSPVIVNIEKSAEEFYLEKYSKKSLYSKLMDIFFYRKLNLGFVKLNFFEPFSLKDLIHASAGKSRNVSELSENDIHSLTPKIITHINYDFCRIHPIMTTDLISYLLLKKFRKDVRLTDLVAETSTLMGELKTRYIRMGFTGSPVAVVKHALSKLGPELVNVEKKDEEFVKPVLDTHSILKMAHYAHKTMMHFMMYSVVFTSISLIFPEEFKSAFKGNTTLEFTSSQLSKAAERLRNVLQFEFTFEKFCDFFENELQDAILKICNDDYITKVEKLMIEEEIWARRHARNLEDNDYDNDDDDDDCDFYDDYEDEDHTFNNIQNRGSLSPLPNIRENDETYTLNLTGEKSLFKQIVFYRNALKPYMDAYSSSAEHLDTLINKQVPLQYYCKTLAEKIAVMLSDGRLIYPETSSLSLLQNSVKLFTEWKVIERYKVDNIEFICLSEKFNDSNALVEVVEKTKILV